MVLVLVLMLMLMLVLELLLVLLVLLLLVLGMLQGNRRVGANASRRLLGLAGDRRSLGDGKR
jgi:hypothetical protein